VEANSTMQIQNRCLGLLLALSARPAMAAPSNVTCEDAAGNTRLHDFELAGLVSGTGTLGRFLNDGNQGKVALVVNVASF